MPLLAAKYSVRARAARPLDRRAWPVSDRSWVLLLAPAPARCRPPAASSFFRPGKIWRPPACPLDTASCAPGRAGVRGGMGGPCSERPAKAQGGARACIAPALSRSTRLHVCVQPLLRRLIYLQIQVKRLEISAALAAACAPTNSLSPRPGRAGKFCPGPLLSSQGPA